MERTCQPVQGGRTGGVIRLLVPSDFPLQGEIGRLRRTLAGKRARVLSGNVFAGNLRLRMTDESKHERGVVAEQGRFMCLNDV
jgi:hypothetical protein